MRAINYNSVPAPVTILVTSADDFTMPPYYMDDVDGAYEGDKALIPIGSIVYFVNEDYKIIIADHVEIDGVVYLLYSVIGSDGILLIGPEGIYDGDYPPVDDSDTSIDDNNDPGQVVY